MAFFGTVTFRAPRLSAARQRNLRDSPAFQTPAHVLPVPRGWQGPPRGRGRQGEPEDAHAGQGQQRWGRERRRRKWAQEVGLVGCEAAAGGNMCVRCYTGLGRALNRPRVPMLPWLNFTRLLPRPRRASHPCRRLLHATRRDGYKKTKKRTLEPDSPVPGQSALTTAILLRVCCASRKLYAMVSETLRYKPLLDKLVVKADPT